MDSIHRYFLRLSYNGANYKGWQTQKNGQTVQSTLNHALNLLLKEEINVVGCGRTDTGVHAINYFAHFDSARTSTFDEPNAFVRRINRILPKDTAVYEILTVLSDANARFSAISRTYEYRITRTRNPFMDNLSLFYDGALDVSLMNQGAKTIMEYSDFQAFSKVHTQVTTYHCKIIESQWQEDKDILLFRITADRFLRNMVRAIVGTLLDLGKHKISLSELRTIIESKDRSNAGMSVPAKGLFLLQVTYPPEIFMRSKF